VEERPGALEDLGIAYVPRLPEQDLEHVREGASEAWNALENARLFVTGGTGFVGSWLLETLLYAHDRLDLGISSIVLTRDPEQFMTANPHLASHPAVEVQRGDVRTFDFPRGEFPFVIHAATPDPAPDVAIEETRRVLEFARTHGTSRFLFTSSGAVYGRQPPDLTHIAEDYACEPVTEYGKAKRASELLCCTYAQKYGFEALIGRLFAFSGPRLPLDRNFALGNFIRDVLEGGPIRVQGDGTAYRSYLYASDLAVWLWTILVRGESSKPYNVGSGDPITIADLARIVGGLDGTPIQIAKIPVAGTPSERYVPCVQKATQELGLQPLITLQDGVRRMHHWAKGPR
jgi:dTDP-glucose 4,6-dehydratase